MTRDEIRDWALAHGFAQGDRTGLLVCPYRGASVTLDFLGRGIRVSVESEGGTRRLGTFTPGPGIQLNDHGVVEGIGLSTGFAFRYVAQDPGSEPPPWMPEEYLRAIGVRGQETGPGW